MRELCLKMPTSNALQWFALIVKHQHEQQVRASLQWMGYEAFAPTYRVRREWSDRIKDVDLPLFAGYVFCRFVFSERVKVLDTPSVSRMVSFSGEPAPIAEEEIATLRHVIAAKLPLRPWPHLKPGDRVRIERGPLRGVEGTLLREKDSLHLVVGVEMLQRSIAVELAPEMVEPVNEKRSLACGA
jgi:transcriptional antiterminator RfaH